MSWSVSFIGKPDAVSRELDAESGRLSGPSKDEFDAVKPSLQTLVAQNIGASIVQLTASGHASFTDGQKVNGNCSVKLDPFYGRLVE